jgi:hypothetical protein
MIRACYRCLLALHPPAFRRQFAAEMLWIFDQSGGTPALLLDGAVSLARQWLLRTGWWRVVAALAIAAIQVTLGGFGMLLFGHRQVLELASDPSSVNVAEFASHGNIAHQPLTVGIVMYLAVFVVGGLVMLIIGITYWMKTFAMRRVR